MGYTTRHELHTANKTSKEVLADIERFIYDNDIYEWGVNTFNGDIKLNTIECSEGEYEEDSVIYFGEEDSKWYSHEEDMRKMSIVIKDVLFMLNGWGEERDDVWREYYLNGKMQRGGQKMKFNEKELE